MKAPAPRVALFCRCGAQWFGRYAALTNEVVQRHLDRCGTPISARTFRAAGHVIKWPAKWTSIDRKEAEWSAKT